MCTYIYNKRFPSLIKIYLLITSFASNKFSSLNAVTAESEHQGIKPCIPCYTKPCYPDVVRSPMMTYHKNKKEFDLGVSINPPTERNALCYFGVYWESQLQANITIDEHGSTISTDSAWELVQSRKGTTFWLVRDAAPDYNFPISGNLSR